MKTNYHTHTTWCDGRNTPREMAAAAIERGFGALGFSSHAMLPQDDVDWVLTPAKAPRYADEIRSLADELRGRIRILCGVEADYVPGGAEPSRSAYYAISPDYIIGSVHFVRAEDGGIVPVDHSPELLADGIRDHFGGSAEAFVRAYFAQVRDSLAFDFDLVGHPDLAPDNAEVTEGRWWTPAQLEAAMGKRILTPNFEHEYQSIKGSLTALL